MTGGEAALFLNAGISGQMRTRRSLVIPPRSLTSSTKPGFFPAVGCLHNPLNNANSLMKLTPRQDTSVCNTGQGTVRDSFCFGSSSSAALRGHACPAAGGWWVAGGSVARQALPEQTPALRWMPAARPARSRRGTCRCFRTRPCDPLVVRGTSFYLYGAAKKPVCILLKFYRKCVSRKVAVKRTHRFKVFHKYVIR